MPWTKHKTRKDGYVVLTILEHRYVMEQHLGRALRRDEHVHHLNGVRDDNRLENLALMTHSDHSRLTSKNRVYESPGRSPATCHPDRPLCAKGLCKACYYREYMRRMRKEKPEVVAEWKRRERNRGKSRAAYKREWRAKRKALGLPYA
jgi:HNH endonuclease